MATFFSILKFFSIWYDLPKESRVDLEKEFYDANTAKIKHVQKNMNFQI